MKSRMSGFSRGVLEARTKLLGIYMAGYWPVSDLRLVLKPWLSVLAEFGGVLYADHDVRFDPRHPTDALINPRLAWAARATGLCVVCLCLYPR